MVVPFGQVLVGGTRLKGTESGGGFTASETDLTVQVGGGVNVMPKGKVGLRIGGDYVHVKAKTGSNTLLDGDSVNGFRFVVGINVPFGMR